jgi:hypothetical protein
MVVNSVVYLVGGCVFSTSYFFGDIRGVIFANCLNMTIRAISCVYFAAAQDNRTKDLPHFISTIFLSKEFLGLTTLGTCACFVFRELLEYATQYLHH